MSLFKKIENDPEDQKGEFEQPYYLDGQHQFRLSFFHYEFIITFINWRKAGEDYTKKRREEWEKMQ